MACWKAVSGHSATVVADAVKWKVSQKDGNPPAGFSGFWSLRRERGKGCQSTDIFIAFADENRRRAGNASQSRR
jgi:hypothetical protein